MNTEIISTEDTLHVRHKVLRKGKPLESCHFKGDNLSTTYHLGILDKNEIIGICSLIKNKIPEITNENQYQLRGMAVLETHQKQGLGNLLLSGAEAFLKNKNIKTMWCNARVSAANFYKRNGFKVIGNSFVIPEVGEHYLMFKNL